MAHASGITVSGDLSSAFADARTGDSVRYIAIEIQDEKLVEVGRLAKTDNFEADWNTIEQHLKPKQPVYIVFRLDSCNMHGNEWALLSYVPDGSPVKERMLYASTRESMKKELGFNYFADDLHGSGKNDFTYEAWLQHSNKDTSQAPLTESEKASNAEATMEIDMGHTREYVHSVAFPVSSEAMQALKSMASNSINVVQLVVDCAKETIELHGSTTVGSASEISDLIPNSHPCFTFYRYEHSFEGAQQSPNLFIYSCTTSSPIKSRMLFSTVKAVAVGVAEDCGIKIEKKFEVSEPNEINQQLFDDELHPQRDQKAKKFVRPKRAGRGRPRLTRKPR